MRTFPHLLVAMSDTHADLGLIRYSAMLARLMAIDEIRFVHLLQPSQGASLARKRDRVLATLESELDNEFTNVPQSIRTSCDVLHGELDTRLSEYAEEQEADLIVVGHNPHHSGQNTLARRLARRAPCSVWMVPDGSAARLRRILVPVDFSEYAADALEVAASLAQLSGGAECLALHVTLHRINVEKEGSHARVLYKGEPSNQQGREQLAYQNFIGAINCEEAKIMPLFKKGTDVPLVIQRTAVEQDMDLIVCATRGRTQSTALVYGSITEEVMTEASSPVLAVKHFGDRLRLLDYLLEMATGRSPH